MLNSDDIEKEISDLQKIKDPQEYSERVRLIELAASKKRLLDYIKYMVKLIEVCGLRIVWDNSGLKDNGYCSFVLSSLDHKKYGDDIFEITILGNKGKNSSKRNNRVEKKSEGDFGDKDIDGTDGTFSDTSARDIIVESSENRGREIEVIGSSENRGREFEVIGSSESRGREFEVIGSSESRGREFEVIGSSSNKGVDITVTVGHIEPIRLGDIADSFEVTEGEVWNAGRLIEKNEANRGGTEPKF